MAIDRGEHPVAWLIAVWPRLGLVCAGFLLATLPVFWSEAVAPLVLAAALLPAYMVHQYEEHGHGRFVADINATIGGGQPLLTPRSAFWINVLAVELAFPLALLLARFVAPGFALLPVWLTLVNAAVHLAGAIRERRVNPGLITAVLLFLPLGGLAAFVVSSRVEAPLGANAAALATAVAVHVAIAAYVLWRKRTLSQAAGRKPASGGADGFTPEE